MMPEPKFEKFLSDLLRDLVTAFVAHPEVLRINARHFSTIIDIAWSGHRADTSRMIGEGGQTFHWLKQLVRMIGEQHGFDAELSRVGEPTTGESERYPEFVARADWPRARLLSLLERTVLAATKQSQCEIDHANQDDETSAIIVRISRNETSGMEQSLKECLKHIFKVIFNANGRLLRLNVERTLPPEAKQPATAAGRFAR